MIDFLTIAVYIVIWWLMLAVLLPIRGEPEEHPEQGHAASAPKKTYLKYKLIATTVISIPITWAVMQLYQ